VPDLWLDAVTTAGIRLLSYDRPGYGGSTPQPGRRVADLAADAAALADELGIGRFAVWGVGGGSPHALACAALLPDRVVAAAAVESLAPYDAPGLDWFAGMAKENIEEFRLAIAGRDALAEALILAAEHLKAADPAQTPEVFGGSLAPPDRAILDAQVAAFVLACMREGLAPGVEGWVEDDLAFVAPWVWTWPACGRRSPCGTASRAGWSRPATSAGLPPRSQAPSYACSPTRGRCRSSSAAPVRSSTGLPQLHRFP
jgi:pimeloyl-ACP methyl ester carboxylesterase